MKLTKEEARWLDDKWNDFYYYFQVEDMFEKDQKDQEIFKNIGKKLSRGKTMTKSTKEIRDAAEQTYRWQKKIEKQLCGKKIVAVRYMTPQEAESSYWTINLSF